MQKVYTETEERIFHAAVAEFGEHGKAGARMQAIADRAGINKALIHYYFRSKDRLYDEVFAFMIERNLGTIFDIVNREGSFEEFLRNFFDTFIDTLSSNPYLPRLFMRDITEGADTFRRNLSSVIASRSVHAPMAFISRFSAAIERGEIRPIDPVQTLISMLGTCLYFFVAFPVFEQLIPPLQGRREAMAEERKQHLFDLFYHGLIVPETHK
jgi:TetR/AcrR family transcriptional regulator